MSPASVPPDSKSPDNVPLDNRSPDGRSPDGRSPDGRSPDGRSPDGRSPDNRSPDGRSPDNRSPDGGSPAALPAAQTPLAQISLAPDASARMTSAAFDAQTSLPDWRIVLRRIEAMFVAPSFADAAAFVGNVADAAEAAGHHPDIDLRAPDRVHVSLSTHSSGGLTAADASLASAISAIASSGGLSSEPLVPVGVEIAIDALDIDAVRPFWKAVLNYDDETSADGQVVALVDPMRIGPAFWFQQMDEPRPQRNRIHLDISVAEDEAERRIAAALAAGGHLVSDGAARAFWVLADAEGNEACICTWQDRE
jgi:4a-hydroxytetrahydrobiopterin dehydratase